MEGSRKDKSDLPENLQSIPDKSLVHKIQLGRNKKLFFDNKIEREWLKTEDAAHFLSVTPNAVRIMVYRGQIRAYKFGNRLRFKLDDCRALFKMKGV